MLMWNNSLYTLTRIYIMISTIHTIIIILQSISEMLLVDVTKIVKKISFCINIIYTQDEKERFADFTPEKCFTQSILYIAET